MPASQGREILTVSVDAYANAGANLLDDVRKWELVPAVAMGGRRAGRIGGDVKHDEIGVSATTQRIARDHDRLRHSQRGGAHHRPKRVTSARCFCGRSTRGCRADAARPPLIGAPAAAEGYRAGAMIACADRRTVVRWVARAALVPAGALAVHQLRYLLAFGGRAGVELRAPGALVSAFGGAVDRVVDRGRRGRVLVGVGAGAGGPDALFGAIRCRWPRYGSCAGCACWRSTSRRSSWRVCSRLGIRLGWREFSGMAAGGRSRPRRVSVWCSRRSSTARAGCWTKSRSEASVRSPVGHGVPPRRAAGAMRCCRGSRRWLRAGRAAALQASADRASFPDRIAALIWFSYPGEFRCSAHRSLLTVAPRWRSPL